MRSYFAMALVLLSAACANVSAAHAASATADDQPMIAAWTAPRQSEPAAPRLPKEGDTALDVRAYYGIPILQRSLFWDGNGEVDQFGIRVRHLWYTSDNVALGLGISLMDFLLGGADVQAAEGDVLGRFYLHKEEDWAAFAELTGGYLQATDGIPPGGTEWNFTFSFGGGVDVPLRSNLDLVTGVTYHHISNALGHENPRNPSQNEAQIWVGFDLRF